MQRKFLTILTREGTEKAGGEPGAAQSVKRSCPPGVRVRDIPDEWPPARVYSTEALLFSRRRNCYES